ncbi:MAG: class I SAM-dependent methyltransferase [Thiothrix sp.]|nr:MAG: class I SAM-dependent methyltransferase [Thiothrix sp.]
MSYITVAKKYTPKAVKQLVARFRKLFVYYDYDSSQYWKKRASDPDQAAVLWTNQAYNSLYRQDQQTTLEPYFKQLAPQATVLDIGCGIGVVARMITQINPNLKVDAVDFPEMIAVAKTKNAETQINYIACEAENYYREQQPYAVILSSGCYSAIRDIKKLEQALQYASQMLAKDGLLIMIDPFHRWNYLARAKYGSQDVINYFASRGLVLEKKSGILFWPFREWLANSKHTGETLRKRYLLGEKLLAVLGKHFWADYKILVFRKG